MHLGALETYRVLAMVGSLMATLPFSLLKKIAHLITIMVIAINILLFLEQP
jgi:hypothetical protein